jgi:phenylalanyl-tRNA synthetase beta chain
LEVEDLKPVAPAFSGVVVGEIIEAIQHPNADRLRVCQVNVGQTTPLNIVCGAPNARVGIRVPCALVGAMLPPGADGKPFAIKLGKLRGVESQGMLCSGRELGLSDDQGGLLELAADAAIGQDIRTHLQLDDTIFSLKLTPNLAHCLSVYGVARELSALTGAPLMTPQVVTVPASHSDVLQVRVQAPDLCGRFSGRIIRNVNTQVKTPKWMVDRLARCGQRSVSPLVDISNYVMFETGQPTHIFDLDAIKGGLVVRWAQAGESLKLLNGATVELNPKVGVIADAHQVESLAGIMGGDATAVSDTTQNIYVEAAFWWPKAVAGRSRQFNFSTDAGHRFERGVDPQYTVQHIERITQLIVDICGTPETRCGQIDDQQPNMPNNAPVTLRVERAAKVIGMPLSELQCVTALQKLGLDGQVADGVITVTPPSHRFDLQIEEDLIEEVARMIGFDQLPHTPPVAPMTAKLRPESERSPFAVRRMMAGLGFQETINYSFVEERWEQELAGNAQPIRLLNPISSQMSVMRSSLLGSLLGVLQFNLARKTSRVRIFEIGRVFLRDSRVVDSDTSVAGYHQPMRIAGLVSGPVDELQWGRKEQAVDFFDIKGDVQTLLAPLQADFSVGHHPAMHPGRCAQIAIQGRVVGYVGELHPQWRQRYELSQTAWMFELELDAVLQRDVPAYHQVSRLQPVQRDIAVVVSDVVTHTALMASIWSAPVNGLLQDAKLFDVYRPKNSANSENTSSTERSLAVRLTLHSEAATLNDDAIDQCVNAIFAQLLSDLGARARV